jgi:hypothetical protein
MSINIPTLDDIVQSLEARGDLLAELHALRTTAATPDSVTSTSSLRRLEQRGVRPSRGAVRRSSPETDEMREP